MLDREKFLCRVKHHDIRIKEQNHNLLHAHVILCMNFNDVNQVANEIMTYVLCIYHEENEVFITPLDGKKN